MRIDTKFAPGDKVWVLYDGLPREVTVGQVRVVVTDSPGLGETDWQNYRAQSGRLEEYMCVETGVGSGTVYTLGQSVFGTRDECVEVQKDLVAKALAEKKAGLRRCIAQIKRCIVDDRKELENLERELALITASGS